MNNKWFYQSCYRAREWIKFDQLANCADIILHLGIATSAASMAELTTFTAFQHIFRLLHVPMHIAAYTLHIRTIFFSFRIKETIWFAAPAELQKLEGYVVHIVRFCYLRMLLDPSCPILFYFCRRQELSFFCFRLRICL